MTVAAVLAEVGSYGARYVTVTGGEPLAQKECKVLLTSLCDAGYSVSLETSGAMDIAEVDPRVAKILDIKTPGSNEMQRNRWTNLSFLTSNDEVKFVLCDERDYRWAIEVMREHRLDHICSVLLSPVHGKLDPSLLGDWILRDRLPVRMQVQLHKLLWGESPGR